MVFVQSRVTVADVVTTDGRYGDDFGPTPRDIVLKCLQYLPASSPLAATATAVMSRPGDWKLEFADYNWTANASVGKIVRAAPLSPTAVASTSGHK